MERVNSMKCKYCNNEISAFAKKCPSCGQEMIHKEEVTTGYEQYIMESKQNVELKQKEGVKQNAGLQQNKEINETSSLDKEQMEEQLQQEHLNKKRMGKRNQYIAIALVVVLVLSSFGFKWVLSRKEYLDTNNVLYSSKSGLSMYSSQTDQKEKMLDNTLSVWDNYSMYWAQNQTMRQPVQYTMDKKYMFFLGNSYVNLGEVNEEYRGYSLYYRENLFGAKPILLAENVTSFVVSKENEVFYLKEDKQQLCKYDFQSEEIMVEHVTSFQVDDSMTRFSYWTEEEGLYVQDLKQEKQPTLMLKGYCYYQLSKDYTQMVSWDVEGTKELYMMKDLKEKELIATKVQSVHTVERNGKLEVYYTVGDSASYTSYDLIEDVLLEQDLVMTEPTPEKYSDGEQNEQYQIDKKEYEKKQRRDVLRNALKSDNLSEKPNELYYYKEGNTRKLHDQVLRVEGNYYTYNQYAEVPCMITTQNTNNIKKIRFTGEETYGELSDAVSSYYFEKYFDIIENYACIPDEEGNMEFLKVGNLQYTPAVFDLENQCVYSSEVLIDQDKFKMNLVKTSYNSDAFGETRECFSTNGMFSLSGLINGYLVVSEELVDGNSTYYLWNETKGKIDLGTYSGRDCSIFESPEGSATYFIKNSGRNKKLYGLDSDGTELLIAENVYSFYIMSDKEVFLITDYEEMTGHGTLRMYNGSEELLTIEEEVTEINSQTVVLSESW